MKEQRIWVFLLGIVLSICGLQAQAYAPRFKVQGVIIDGRTKVGIKRIPFNVLPFKREISANNKGEFLLSLPAGEYHFVVDYAPFDRAEVRLDLKKDTSIVIELHSPFESQYIQEVEVMSTKSAIKHQTSVQQIDSRALAILPALVGERDVLKALAQTAGVTASSEGAADMQVRGGNHGQNLYLLDGVPLYSTQHFFGMVSAYNPLIVRSAKLYKSGFPAAYGGKISSVVDVYTGDANTERFSGALDVSLLSSKLLLNIPLQKNKLAFTVSGRISNYSLVNLGRFQQLTTENSHPNMFFSDVNANLFWKISEKDKLKLTLFNNSDGFGVTNMDEYYTTKSWMDNKQKNLGLNWYHSFSKGFENHLLVYADSYGFDFGYSNRSIDSDFVSIGELLTGIKSVGVDDKISYNLSDKWTFTSGLSYKMTGFQPTQIHISDETVDRTRQHSSIQVSEATAFVESVYQFLPNQTLTSGLRMSIFGNSASFYPSLEPRLLYHGIFQHDVAISAAVCRLTQPVHRLANTGLGVPFEIFMPSGDNLLPASSWNFSAGFAKDFRVRTFSSSLKMDFWYKTFRNIAEFQDGYDALSVMFNNLNIEGQLSEIVAQGKGNAYGVDVSGNVTHKNWSFSADYTLMQAIHQFDALNEGKPFAASTDIRHAIYLMLERKISRTLTMALTWQYRSGKPITVPKYVYEYPTYNSETGALTHEYTNLQIIETERNNYRTSAFHKLDITLTRQSKAFKRFDSSSSIGLYNVYNRANPYIYFLSRNWHSDGTFSPVLKSISLFPILPSFSWSMKF